MMGWNGLLTSSAMVLSLALGCAAGSARPPAQRPGADGVITTTTPGSSSSSSRSSSRSSRDTVVQEQWAHRLLQGDHQGGVYYPEQVHLSLSGKPGEMVIDWVSSAPPGTAMVQHSSRPWQGKPLNAACASLNRTGPPKCNPPNVPCAPGDCAACCCGCNPNSAHSRGWSGCQWNNQSDSCENFIHNTSAMDVGTSKEMGETSANYTLHSAVLTGLECGREYFYRLGSAAVDRWWEQTELISFHMLCDKGYGGREPIWAAYGDLGLAVDEYRTIAPAIPMLSSELQSGERGPAFDGVLHAGDYAYDFSSDGGRIGDAFMNAIQPYAAKVPYMGAVGNHECGGGNLQHYARRFAGLENAANSSGAKSAGSTKHGDALWYSWDTGLIHFIAINSEDENGRDSGPNMSAYPGSGNCVWNPSTNRSLKEEFVEWLEQDLIAVNKPEQRKKTPWVVSFAHKGWYMQPGCNFSAIDDLAHKYGIDLHIAGHIHTYQRFYPLRTSPIGPNPSKPNNRPADVDFDCASTGVQTPEAAYKNFTIVNNTYTDPKYLVTIVAGSPGDHEVTPPTPDGAAEGSRCTGSIDHPSLNMPMAACRENYGYGYLQGTNRTHLHWTFKYAGFGTPSCTSPPCAAPDPSSWPETVFHDELWIVKKPGSHGPRLHDAPSRLDPSLADTSPYEPEDRHGFKEWYEASRDEWHADGCGELPPDTDGMHNGCEVPGNDWAPHDPHVVGQSSPNPSTAWKRT